MKPKKYCQITHRIVDGYFYLSSPYNPAIVLEAHKRGGTWIKNSKEWKLSLEQGLDLVDDWIGKSEEIVTVEVEQRSDDQFGWIESEHDGFLLLGGYIILHRGSRNSVPEKFGTMIRGTIPESGGSVRHPAVNCSPDSVFQLNVRKDFADQKKLKIIS